MKKFNCTVETPTSAHCFSFLATDIESALKRLLALKLEVLVLRALSDDWGGTIRVPEEMY